jgi:hypothetical protein
MKISEIVTTLVEIRFVIRYCGIGFTKVVGSMGVGVVYVNGLDMRSCIVLSRIPVPSFGCLSPISLVTAIWSVNSMEQLCNL